MRKLFFVFISFIFLSSLKGQVPSEEVNRWLGDYVGFEPNLGQVQDFEGKKVNDVLFRAKLPGYGIFITERGVSYVIYKIEERKGERFDFVLREGMIEDETKVEYARLDVELLGGRVSQFDVEYEEPLPGYANYYLSSCPDGVLGVMTYRRVRIREVYPGVDWV